MDKEIHIFPFFSKDNIPAEKVNFLEEKDIFLRGIAMEKRRFDPKIPLSYNGQHINDPAFYWHPSVQSIDYIEQGIELMKTGLGFGTTKGAEIKTLKKVTKKSK